MPQSSEQTLHFIDGLKRSLSISDFKEKLNKNALIHKPLPERIPAGNDFSTHGLEQRRDFLRKAGC